MTSGYKGLRQVSVYVDPDLYERVRCSAYTIGEDIYEFFGAALRDAVVSRLTSAQRSSVDKMIKLGTRPAPPAPAPRSR